MSVTSRETVTCDRKNKTCDLCDERIDIGQSYLRLYWHDLGYSGITVSHVECAKGEAKERQS